MPRFIINKLKIDSMPGFPDGMPQTFEFSERINIIHGANATGKSSLARAMSTLFWHGHNNDYRLLADFSSDQEGSGKITIGYGMVIVKDHPSIKNANDLSQEENIQPLYALALETMINKDETVIADVIMRESNGGYDLSRIVGNEEERLVGKNAGNKEKNEYYERVRTLNEESEKQKQLQDNSRDIEKLEQEIKSCDLASARKKRLERIEEWLNTAQEATQKKQTVDSFHPDHEGMIGNEGTNLKDAYDRKQKAENEKNQFESDRKTAIEKIHALALPDDGLDIPLLNTISRKVKDWQERLDRISRDETTLNGLLRKRQEVMHLINENVDPAGLEPPGKEDINELEQLIARHLELANRTEGLKERIDLIEHQIGELKTPALDPTMIAQAKAAIQRWMELPAEEKTSKQRSNALWVAFALFITIVLVFAFGKAYVLIAVFIIIGLFVFDNKKNVTIPNPLRQSEIDRLKNLSINITGDPTPETMSSLLLQMLSMEQIHANRKSLYDQMHTRSNDKAALDQQLQHVTNAIEGIRERMRNVPAFDPTSSETYLFRFVKAWMQWHDLSAEIQKVQGEIDVTRLQADALKNECRNHFDQIGLAFGSDPVQLNEILLELIQKENERLRFNSDLNNAIQNITNTQIRIDQEEQTICEILDKFSPENQTLQAIQALQLKHKEYQRHENDLQTTEQRLSEKHAALLLEQEPELFTDGQFISTLERVQQLINECDEKVKERDGFRDRLQEINTRINEASKGISLEEKTEARDTALALLDDVLNRKLDAIGLKAVRDVLIESNDEENRPDILIRASDYFSRFTQGRYRLSVTNDHNSRFVIYDDLTGRKQSLSELSAATKLQLVLAVRLAYIDHVEKGYALPLMVDEVLMNSDDMRAREIMQMLGSISEKRQIFYFTASRGELGLWHDILQGITPPIQPLFIPLGEALPFPRPEGQTIENPFRMVGPEIMSADGKTHAEYGQEIHPPAFRLLVDETDQLHVWYFVEEPTLVEQLLRLSIPNWRILQGVWKKTTEIPGMDDHLIGRYESMIKMLKEFQEAYRKGRNKPIDVETLLKCSAITNTFKKAAAELLIKYEGDPMKYIKALENRELANFREKSRTELKEYLIENGYLTEEDPESEDQIQARVILQADRLGVGRDLMERFFDRVLG